MAPTASWTKVDGLTVHPPATSLHSHATTSNGDVVVFGGLLASMDFAPSDLWLFSAEQGSWVQLPADDKAPCPRWGAALACNGDNVYVFGGHNATGTTLSDLHVYNFGTNTWKMLCPLMPTFNGSQVPALSAYEDTLYVLGGHDSAVPYILCYNLIKKRWVVEHTRGHVPDVIHSIFANDGMLYVLGEQKEVVYLYVLALDGYKWSRVPVSLPGLTESIPAAHLHTATNAIVFTTNLHSGPPGTLGYWANPRAEIEVVDSSLCEGVVDALTPPLSPNADARQFNTQRPTLTALCNSTVVVFGGSDCVVSFDRFYAASLSGVDGAECEAMAAAAADALNNNSASTPPPTSRDETVLDTIVAASDAKLKEVESLITNLIEESGTTIESVGTAVGETVAPYIPEVVSSAVGMTPTPTADDEDSQPTMVFPRGDFLVASTPVAATNNNNNNNNTNDPVFPSGDAANNSADSTWTEAVLSQIADLTSVASAMFGTTPAATTTPQTETTTTATQPTEPTENNNVDDTVYIPFSVKAVNGNDEIRRFEVDTQTHSALTAAVREAFSLPTDCAFVMTFVQESGSTTCPVESDDDVVALVLACEEAGASAAKIEVDVLDFPEEAAANAAQPSATDALGDPSSPATIYPALVAGGVI